MALTIDELNIQIAADSSKASRALTSLIKKLEKLKGTLTGTNTSNITISNSFNKVTTTANKATTATNKYDSATKKTSKNTKSFSDNLAQQISKWRTLIGVFKSAANTMSAWFKESNDYIETLNLFNVTMGDSAEAARKYANTVQEAMGIDVAEWMQNQGVFKNLVSGFGVAEEAANTMSQNLTQLSYDMASFFNTDVETAFDKLSSAMSGQVKGLREFGIDTTVASLQEYALARGIDAKVRSMTQAEKSMLRYNYIMEKSIIMQGDMARTIITPANALRILSAQFTQLKRALGNIISVVVTQFIPYVQAMVRVLTDAANAIANFFGFELPTIDYSGFDTTGYADELEEGEDAINGTSDTLKKIKKQLMGFDELNIISNPETDSANSDNSSSGVLNMPVRDYDFLKGLDTSAVDELYKKLKKLVSPLKKVWNYLVDYEDTLKAIGGIIAGFAIVKGLKKVGTALLALGFVDYFVEGFTVAKSVGVGFFRSIGEGIENVRYNLSGLQKALIVVVAGIVEFFAIKDSVKALVEGTDNVAANIVTIGVVAGAAATAMYVALGPAGLAVAAVVGLAGALVGVMEGMNTLEQKFINTVVFDGYGLAIGEITGLLEGLWESIATKSKHINELGDKVKANDEKITQSLGGITTYMGIIQNTGTITSEQAQAMSDDVAALAKSIKENIGYNSTVVFETFAAVSTSTADTLGVDVAYMTKILQTFQKTFSDKVVELEGQAQGYLTRLANGEILSDAELKDFQDTLSYLNEMSGQTYANQQEIKRALENIADVNFGNVEEAQQAITDIANLGQTMTTELDEAYNNTLHSIETLEGQAKAMFDRGDLSVEAYNQFADVMKSYREGIKAGYEAEKENINNQLYTVYDYIGDQVAAESVKVYDEAIANWDNLNIVQRMWYINKHAYADEMMSEFKKNIGDPIIESFEGVGTSVAQEAESMMQNFYDAVLTSAEYHTFPTSKELKKSALEAIAGYAQGIKENESKSTVAFEEMIKTGLNAVKEAQDSHSPSKEFEKLGRDAVLGYEVGIDNNFNHIESAFKNSFKELFNGIKELVTNGLKDVSNATNSFSVSGFTKTLDSITTTAKSVFSASTWTGYANNVTNALAKIKTPTFKNIGLGVSFDSWVSSDKEKVYKALGLPGFPYLNWYAYANGGFPDMGEMFIAREAGPELVGSIGRKTAVANNDQIISGIESGVYRAMMAANSTNGGGTQTIRIINEIDGDVVGEKVIKYHNGKVMQTGTSPLLV